MAVFVVVVRWPWGCVTIFEAARRDARKLPAIPAQVTLLIYARIAACSILQSDLHPDTPVLWRVKAQRVEQANGIAARDETVL